MRYYMIRHKATGEFMPELKRTRGYSWWNPAKVDTREVLDKKLKGTPRLFASRRKAACSIAQWACIPNGRLRYCDDGDDLDIKEDGRMKSDLEIVEVDIVELTNGEVIGG